MAGLAIAKGNDLVFYTYDAGGMRATKTVNGEKYTYQYLDGRLYNGSGDLVAKYEYDSWGMVRSVKDANNANITDQNHVGNLNPFRYRGYYYDKETQLYYLMSRYYDPVTHRFLNARMGIFSREAAY